jgi:hypothetical protein
MRSLKFLSLLLPLVSVFAEPEESFFNESLFHKNKKIYFHHIPKTAGISAIEHLSASLRLSNDLIDLNPRGKFYHYPTNGQDSKIINLLANTLTPYTKNSISWSHLPFYYLDNYSNDVCCFTLLRNPVRRQISYKLYYKHQYLTKFKEECEFANACYLTSSDTFNLQTLYLSSLNPYDMNVDMQDHLESAKFNLKYKIAFFGLSECLQDSLDEFTKRMDGILGLKVGFLNATCNIEWLKEPFDEEKLKQGNWADIELYEFAKTLFYERFPHLKTN